MAVPLLSIIIPTFNAAGFIRRALDSIFVQDFKQYEIWVVDGSSDDSTLSIIDEYKAKDQRIHSISEKDKGIYDGMNKGARLASGDWLYFMGSDDKLYDEQVLMNFFKYANSNKYDLIYGDVLTEKNNKVYGGKFSYHRLLLQNICHQAIFLKKDVFERFGPFNIQYKVLADHEFNLTVFKNGVKAKYIHALIAVFGAGGYSAVYYDIDFVKRFDEIYQQYSNHLFNRIRLKLSIMLGNHKKLGE